MNEDHIQPVNETKEPGDSTEKPENKPPLAPANVSKVDPPRNASNPDTDKKKRKRKPLSCFEIWAVALTIIGILVAASTGVAIVWQDVIGSRTLVEVQKQNTLIRQQLEGTTAASVRADGGIGLDNGGSAGISLVNDGHIAARDVIAKAQITKIYPQSLKKANDSVTLLEYQIPSMSQLNTGYQKQRNLDLTPAEMEKILHGELTLKIEGTATYNNGFDRTMSVSFCKIHLIVVVIPGRTLQDTQQGAPNMIDNTNVDCDDFPATYSRDIKWKTDAQEKHNPN